MGQEQKTANEVFCSRSFRLFLSLLLVFFYALFLSRQRKRAKKNGAAQMPRGCFSLNSARNQPPPAKRVTCCSGVFRDNRGRLVLAFEVAGERHVFCREQKPPRHYWSREGRMHDWARKARFGRVRGTSEWPQNQCALRYCRGNPFGRFKRNPPQAGN